MSNFVPVTVNSGQDWIVNHQAYQSDGVTAQDLTGATIYLQIGTPKGVVVIPYTAVTVQILSPATLGKSVLTIPKAQQYAYNAIPGTYEYTLRILLASGSSIDYNEGPWTVKRTMFPFGF